MINDISEIMFLGMAYSPVVANLKEQKKWQKSTLDPEFDDRTIKHFKGYIQSLWNSETEKSKPYDITGHITFLKGERSKVATLCAKVL